MPLPIAAYKNELVAAIKRSNCLVVVGETGSGKTTQLPQYIHEAGITAGGPVVVTQPRRVAAVTVAARVADEANCELGGLVGYEIRFDKKITPATKIKFVTAGR